MNTNITCELSDLLQMSSARHGHLCPRQVLGVRIGLAGLAALGLARPVEKKTALVIVETDGCFADGVEVATGASVGHRTLRVADFGKVAATFADVQSGRTLRLAPLPGLRERAVQHCPEARNHYEAQLRGYQIMPAAELFSQRPVALQPSLQALLSRPGVRTTCDRCGEEIMNERQLLMGGQVLCLACAGQAYYLEDLPACSTRTLSLMLNTIER